MIVSKNQYWENEAQKRAARNPVNIQYATVIELTRDGEPILQFLGDTIPSQKTYVRFKSYLPEIGDRVQLINNVIQGGWRPSNI